MASKIVCVVGPTACGKTKLGVLLAQRFHGEVVSADSMQIYRGMTIGTAAPTPGGDGRRPPSHDCGGGPGGKLVGGPVWRKRPSLSWRIFSPGESCLFWWGAPVFGSTRW